jgi:Rrf2 family iron-sulfur cluster assembly transcriptional regulator
MAMAELAAREQADSPDERGGRRQVSLADIAQAQHLSLAYLEQLFGPLRRAGLVTSARGPGGGYRLARPAGEISVSEIIEAVDEPLHTTRCEDGGPGCLDGQRCLTHDLWAELGDQIRLFLQALTLADVIGGRVLGRAVSPRRTQDLARPAGAAP